MRLSISIHFLVATTTLAAAQPTDTGSGAPTGDNGWTVGVAPRVGGVLPTSDLGPTGFVGLELAVALPVLDRQLILAADLSALRASHDGSVMDTRVPSPATYELDETELVVALQIVYRFSGADASLVPWAGGGPMLHVLRTRETTSIAPGENTASSTEPGIQLCGGIDYRLGPGFLVGDLRFAYSKLDHELTGSTNAGKLALGIGYRFVF